MPVKLFMPEMLNPWPEEPSSDLMGFPQVQTFNCGGVVAALIAVPLLPHFWAHKEPSNLDDMTLNARSEPGPCEGSAPETGPVSLIQATWLKG